MRNGQLFASYSGASDLAAIIIVSLGVVILCITAVCLEALIFDTHGWFQATHTSHVLSASPDIVHITIEPCEKSRRHNKGGATRVD